MEVDHVISIDLARKNIFYRWLLLGKDVNSLNNLVASCHKCNKRKSNNGGLWVIRGKIGPYLQPALWIIFILLLNELYFYAHIFWAKVF